MADKYAKVIGTGLLVLLGATGTVGFDAIAARSDGQMPIRSLSITIGYGATDRFFDQVRKFADAHAFAVRIAPTTPDGKHFLVQMWREDIKVIGANPFDPPETFEISFYKNGEQPVEPAAINLMIRDLENGLKPIAGITFTERN
jgi:hypothetical protein